MENDDKRDEDRDQTGLKDSQDYPRGEDPLGTLELHRTERRTPIKTNRVANRLRVNETQFKRAMSNSEDLKSIKDSLKKRLGSKQKGVIAETSMLDEDNLVDNDKGNQ